jgi:hypothetical protein
LPLARAKGTLSLRSLLLADRLQMTSHDD